MSSVVSPNTRESLARDLSCLGVGPGMTIIVHSSLKSLGWVCGGPVGVVQALMDVLTPEGTLVMPTHSTDYTEPSQWQCPPVPKEWWQPIRETMPAFDPAVTPTRGMGAIPETFRKFPGVLRSYHPAVSFTAWGKHAQVVTANHSLDFPLGENSPLARIYELQGSILLLGVGHDANTSLHLAEARFSRIAVKPQAGPIVREGQRAWQTYQEHDINDGDFPEIGKAFAEVGEQKQGRIGAALTTLIAQRPLVDFAVTWMENNR